MIANPIIPVWLMSLICVTLAIVVIFNKQLYKKTESEVERTPRQKQLIKKSIINSVIKIMIIIILFVINLRLMVPNDDVTVLTSDYEILFVIDSSLSMRALDYNGEKERFEGCVKDSCAIIDSLPMCKFSIITFANQAKRLAPFTSDTDMIKSEIRNIVLEEQYYAQGTSINLVKNLLEKTLKDEYEKRQENAKLIVFFMTDGEITKENETLESFSNIKKYISDGAIMGYGTTTGGKMQNQYYEPSYGSYYKYIEYFDKEIGETVTAISKLDENNLKKLSSDLGIDYVQMNRFSDIDYKITDIKDKILNSQTNDEKVSAYKDIYYYFSIPLVILLIVNFIVQKRRT